MPRFIINKNQQANGDHEVHNVTTGCSHMPNPENQIDLGTHAQPQKPGQQKPGQRAIVSNIRRC